MALRLPFPYLQCIALIAATYGRAAVLAVALEGLGLGGPPVPQIRPASAGPNGSEVSAIILPFLPKWSFLSEPAVLPASAELTQFSFFLS